MPAALVVLSVAGCGGGSDSTASTAATTEATPTLSKADLISQGDAICAEVNAAVGSVGTSEAAVPQQVTQVSDLYVGMVDSIQRLGTPDEPAGYSEFIEAAEELSTVEGEAKLAAEREDTAALGEAATKAAPALEEFEAQAGVYGFEDCSKGPSAPTSSGAGGGSRRRRRRRRSGARSQRRTGSRRSGAGRSGAGNRRCGRWRRRSGPRRWRDRRWHERRRFRRRRAWLIQLRRG